MKIRNILFSVVSTVLVLLTGISAIAETGVSNLFIGEINGKEVVGYLDYTYKTYFNDGMGNESDACFVTFDDYGIPEYRIGIRFGDRMDEGTYTQDSKRYIMFTSVDIAYNENDYSWDDDYDVLRSDNWRVTFDEIDHDRGIIRYCRVKGCKLVQTSKQEWPSAIYPNLVIGQAS